jgi:hypothetical protein
VKNEERKMATESLEPLSSIGIPSPPPPLFSPIAAWEQNIGYLKIFSIPHCTGGNV